MEQKPLEDRVADIENKLDDIMEMVYLGRHLFLFCKFLAWAGGIYLSIETFIRTFYSK